MINEATGELIMSRSEWSLEEAISFIKGHEPQYFYHDENGYPTEKEHAATVETSTKYMQSRTAKKYIEHNFPLMFDEIYSLPNTERSRKKIYGQMAVKPREFLEWCEKEKIPTPESFLGWFLDYTHWIFKEEWNFDEAYLILHSPQCPLPSEIFDVLENEETYESAKAFHELTHSKHEHEFGFIVPAKGDYVVIAKEAGVKFPKTLERVIEMERNKKEKRNKEWEKKTKVDFEKWLKMPIWTAHEALCLACSKIPTSNMKVPADFLSVPFEKYKHALELFNRANTVEPFEFIVQPERYDSLDGSLKPETFISWFKSADIKLPQELNDFFTVENQISGIENLPYASPYMLLMVGAIKALSITAENQPYKKHIIEWFQKQKIDGIPLTNREINSLASLVRMPEAKKGGNRKAANG